MRTEVRDVNPKLAAKWLTQNTGNRPIKAHHLTDLVNAMLNHKFMLIHQPVAFASDGRLLDGQHRLQAVVDSGMTVPMMVTFDADPDTFNVIDAGNKRSIADGLAIRHSTPAFAKVNVGASRVVAIYDRIDDRTSTTPWNQRTVLNVKLDRRTMADIADELFRDMNRLILDVKDYNRGFRLQSNWLAALFVIRRDSAQAVELIEEFIRGFVTGESLPTGDVRLKLRDSFANNPAFKSADARMGFGVTVKAWNLFVVGEEPKVLRFVRSMPGAVPL